MNAPALFALAFIGLLIGGAFVGLVVEGAKNPATAFAAFDTYLLRIAAFTLWQAGLSMLLSVVPAIFVARALSRHPSFPGRALIVRLFSLPLAIPAIVAALGVLALYGRAGFLAPVFAWMSGGNWPGIYGLSGILVAHVFFNLPLATRLLLEALDTVPDDQWRLASQLGMGARPSFRLIEWPAIRAAIPGAAGLVFMLCVTSFTIVLMLGGGPAATTIEVAIYQALRFDFDPARAVALTLAQIALTVAIVFLLAKLGADPARDPNIGVSRRRYTSVDAGEAGLNLALIALATLFVAGPMLAIVIAGLDAELSRLAGEATVQRAVFTSLVLAVLSALLSVALTLALVLARGSSASGRDRGRRSLFDYLADTGAGFVLVVPPIVIGAGWFILLRNFTDVFLLAPFMVVTVNAVMAMPFVVRAIRPAHDVARARHERLVAQLGITGWSRFRLIDFPPLKRSLTTGLAFATALSLGDLGVIALFGSDTVQTLPYLLLQRMGSYRTADAAGLALFLGLLCLALAFFAERIGKEPDNVR
jgi:thiamine transport system permease protein